MRKYKLELPESMNDIPLWKWQKLAAIDPKSTEEFHNRRILQIVYDIEGKDIDGMKGNDVKTLLSAVEKCTAQKGEFRQRFTLNGVEFGLIPNFDDMTFGELVDLDKYSELDQYHRLMGILYRPVTKTQIGGLYDIESYNGAGDMGHMPAGIALSCVAFFLTIESDLIQGYPELFDRGGTSDGRQVSFGKKWGWFSSIYELAGGDIERADNITQLNINQVLTWLAYKSDLVEIQRKK